MQATVRVKKLNENAQLPRYGSEKAAGADLYACLDCDSVSINAGETVFIKTGIAEIGRASCRERVYRAV